MSGNLPVRHGGKIIVDALKKNGVDTVFCLPGESFLGVLDSLLDTPEIKLVTCRHEAGAAFMAEAYGKLTGKPAVCLVTRGPGACNASIGLHAAKHDSTPMIVLIGHATRYEVQRESFQEIEYRNAFPEITKWVAQIDSVDRIPEFISRAVQLSQSGRKGPVALVMPEDMLEDEIAIPDAPPALPIQAEPSARQMAALRALLEKAQRPFMIVGSSIDDRGVEGLVAFAEANAIPTTIAFRRHDNFDMTSAVYSGDLGYGTIPMDLPDRVKQSDLIVAVGTRLNTIVTQDFTLFERLGDNQQLVHVHPDSAEIGRLYTPVLGIQSGVTEFADAARAMKPVDSGHRTEMAGGRARRLCRDAHADALRQALRPRQGDAAALRMAAERRHRFGRCGRVFELAAPFPAVQAAVPGADRQHRRDGLLRPGGGRRGRDLSRAPGGQHPRRRQHADDGAGDRDRDPERRRADHHRLQQQHLRHDPPEPGAHVPRPGLRHQPRQSGLRRLGALLRRAWRDGREDGGIHARAGARGGERQGGGHRAQGRSRPDHRAHDADGDPRDGAGGEEGE